MSDLRAIDSVDLQRAFGTRAVTKATLAGSGAAATVSTTGTNVIMVDGVFVSFAAWTVQSIAITPSAGALPVSLQAAYVQPIATTVYYVVCMNAAGTVGVVQGSYAGQAIAAIPGYTSAMTGIGGLPQLPSGYAPIGIIKVVTTSGTFTPATTLWNAGGFTATFTDVSVLPTVAP